MLCWSKTTNNRRRKSFAALWNKYEGTLSWLTGGWMKSTPAVISSIFSYLHRRKPIAWSYESITRPDGMVPPMNHLRVPSNSTGPGSYRSCKCEEGPFPHYYLKHCSRQNELTAKRDKGDLEIQKNGVKKLMVERIWLHVSTTCKQDGVGETNCF